MQNMLLNLRSLQQINTRISEKSTEIKQTKAFYTQLFSENLQELTSLLGGLKKMRDLHTRSAESLYPLQSGLFDLSHIQELTRSLSDEIDHLTQQAEVSMNEQKGTEKLANLHEELERLGNEQVNLEKALVQGFWDLSDNLKSVQYETADMFAVHYDVLTHILVTEHSVSPVDAADIVNLVTHYVKGKSEYSSSSVELVRVEKSKVGSSFGLGEDPFEVTVNGHTLQKFDLDKTIDKKKNHMIISGTVDVQIEGDVSCVLDEDAGVFATKDQHWILQGYTLQNYIAVATAHVEFVFDMDRCLESSDIDLRQEEVKFTLPVLKIEPCVNSDTLNLLVKMLMEEVQKVDVEELAWGTILSEVVSKDIEDSLKSDIEDMAKEIEFTVS